MTLSSDPRQAAIDLIQPGAGGGQTLWMEVRGNSMFPTLRPDDRVEVEGVRASALRCGDIVVLDSGEVGWVIHRFFGWRRGTPAHPLTRGDARTCFDPVWPSMRLIGRVRAFQRNGMARPCGRAWLLMGTLRSILVWCRAKVRRLISPAGAS